MCIGCHLLHSFLPFLLPPLPLQCEEKLASWNVICGGLVFLYATFVAAEACQSRRSKGGMDSPCAPPFILSLIHLLYSSSVLVLFSYVIALLYRMNLRKPRCNNELFQAR